MWQDNHSINAAGHFAVAGADAVALAEEYGTPLYVMDEALVRRQMRLYADAMREYLPAGSMPFFASKALSFKEMYRIAAQEGIGADVVSAGELYTALSAGFPAERICCHGSAKTDGEIRYAVASGAGRIVVDNLEELRRVDVIAGELGKKQPVLLRLTPGIDPHTFEAVNTGRADSKFGMSIETGQALAVTQAALAAEHIVLDGFHCHVGSQIWDAAPFLDAADIMTAFMASVRDGLGYTAKVLNLGGGAAAVYGPEDTPVDIPALIRAVGVRLEEKCAAYALPLPAVFMEPGRSIVAEAGVTLYRVQNVKVIPGYKSYIAIDGGMTDNPRFALYGARHAALVANRASDPADFKADIAGRCCESGDLLGTDVLIQRPEAGDVLAVLTTGAYNYSMASNYNRVPRPPVVMLRDGRARLAVRRETFENLTACDL